MKNRNTKVIGGDHIYPFIIACLGLIMGLFFSLRSIPELSFIFYSLSLNLFVNWSIFHLFVKRKLKHLTEFYNNLYITAFSLASFGATLLFTFLSLGLPNWVLNGTVVLLFAILSVVLVPLGLFFYRWEKDLELLIRDYRMADWREKERYFLPLKQFIEKDDASKVLSYVEKHQLYNTELETYLKKKITSQS